MSNIRKIKDLSREDNISLLRMLKKYIFGNTDIREYDPNKIYSRENVIVSTDENGNFALKQPIIDDVTGEYDDKLWTTVTISGIIPKACRKFDVVMVSTHAPREELNQLWYKPIGDSYETDDFNELFNDELGAHIVDDFITISDDQPYSIENILWYKPTEITDNPDFDE